MKKKRSITQPDDSKLEDLVNQYFRKAAASGVEDNGDFDREGVFQRVRNSISTKRRQIRTFWAAAASILLLLGITLLWQQYPVQKASLAIMTERLTGTGHTLQIQLEDGTIVWLNAGSKLRYPAAFAADKREVFIEGEAYLEVSQDAKRPFLVHTGDVITRVLGTSFNVTTYPKEVEVTVLTGKVSLGNTLLSPGQQAACNQDGKVMAFHENMDARETIRWKEHKMIYDSKRLSQVAASLERWYGIKIQPDARLAGCIISADFTGESVENVMAVLAQLVNGKVIRKGDSYNILGESCGD
jgi:ferric-dicitrate binding protein FerR (iron transport regulator)